MRAVKLGMEGSRGLVNYDYNAEDNEDMEVD